VALAHKDDLRKQLLLLLTAVSPAARVPSCLTWLAMLLMLVLAKCRR
jgi:hypothetical protein